MLLYSKVKWSCDRRTSQSQTVQCHKAWPHARAPIPDRDLEIGESRVVLVLYIGSPESITLIRSHQRRADAATTTPPVKALSDVVRGSLRGVGSGEAESGGQTMACISLVRSETASHGHSSTPLRYCSCINNKIHFCYVHMRLTSPANTIRNEYFEYYYYYWLEQLEHG